jgi:hypothetical protein
MSGSEELRLGVNGRVHGFSTGDPTQKNSA